MSRSACLGIDPGACGSIVVLSTSGEVEICRLDQTTEREVYDFLKGATEKYKVIGAVIEKSQPMPMFELAIRRGTIAGFKLGQSYGFLRGCLICSGVPFEEVRPQVWQKSLECLSKGDKRVTRARAQQLFPNMKVVHAFADGLLLAEFCRRRLIERGVQWQ